MPNPGITKKAIADSMKKLMAQRPLSKISIRDIVEECGLNRNSFYYHFKDKFDLVNWIFYTEFMEEFSERDVEDRWGFLEAVCEFFYRDRAFYVSALSVSGQDSFSEYFTQMMGEIIVPQVEDLYRDDDEYKDFYISFFIRSFMSSLSRWLSEGAQIPPKKLVELIRNISTGVALKIVQDLNQPGQG